MSQSVSDLRSAVQRAWFETSVMSSSRQAADHILAAIVEAVDARTPGTEAELRWLNSWYARVGLFRNRGMEGMEGYTCWLSDGVGFGGSDAADAIAGGVA